MKKEEPRIISNSDTIKGHHEIKRKQKGEQEEQINKVIQALDGVSEQTIRQVLYSIIKNYPYESRLVIDGIILKQNKAI